MSFVVDAGQYITTRRELMSSSEKELEKEIAKQAKTLLKKWVPIFGLKDWIIKVKTVPANTLQTPQGPACMSTTSHNGSRTITLWIDYEFNWNDKDGHNGFEFTVVHELLHVIFTEQGIDIFKGYLDKRGEKLYYEYEEESIDRVAKILLSAQG